jgi:imidazolonepropionase-like amidohydrolase
MAHASSRAGIKSAIRAGIRSIEHGDDLDDETIQMMLDRGTFLVPTLVASLGIVEAADAGLSLYDGSLEKILAVTELHRNSMRRAAAAGVKIAMGTDSGVTPHGDNLRELGLMQGIGMTPEAVLKATTSTAAELMGLQEELGTIAPGKRADLVVVDGDPLHFDGLDKRITAVYKDGHLVVKAGRLVARHEDARRETPAERVSA